MKNVNSIITGEIGSYAHGLQTPESDHDHIGIYIDPPAALIGLAGEQGAIRDRDQAEGVKSKAGDIEITYYGLRKYAQLACQGNPTVMTLLFTPNLMHPDVYGLQGVRDMFLSKRLVARHIGYADNMAARLTGDKAPRTNRPDLVEKYGFDTKAAFHALRLLMQGLEMITTGTMTMPMHAPQRSYLLAIRFGAIPQEQVLEDIQRLKYLIKGAGHISDLPEHPDMDRVNDWLTAVHVEHWRATGLEPKMLELCA